MQRGLVGSEMCIRDRIVEDGTSVLFTGCAHSGIGNMIDTTLTRTGRDHIDHVIGGFHLYNRITKATEPDNRLDILVNELSSHDGTTYYTGHCTGPDAPGYMKKKKKKKKKKTTVCYPFLLQKKKNPKKTINIYINARHNNKNKNKKNI
eukprot:TRINITY_DN33701_c0_g1_i1.p1 TRINITY_DN33701_c0_g1~~TRINITY_DN33701_c0_g1_i1.p1  ORF type:complete len:149 (+),score=42.17 TRINITY_DN33701_c0_g1_i1:111-557(+)